MSYVKRSVKNILNHLWIVGVIIIPLFVIGIIACNKKPKEVVIITEKKSHLGIGNDLATIDIKCYIAKEFSFYLEKDQIVECELIDRLNNTKFTVDIKEITADQEYLEYNNQKLYAKTISLIFDYLNDYIIKIPDACVRFTYQNNEQHSIEVGSMVFVKDSNYQSLQMEKIKGIINKVIPDNNQLYPTTVGLVLKLNSDKKQTIKKIELLNGYGEIMYNEIKVLSKDELDSQTNINDLVNYELIIRNNISECNISVNENESLTLLLPISYYKLETICTTGLCITNDLGETQIINEFPLFSSTNMLNNYSIYVFNPSK